MAMLDVRATRFRVVLGAVVSLAGGAVFASSTLAADPAPEPAPQGQPAAAVPGANDAAATAAFNSAKELGTAEAWNAFLANYPTGFHADLARAYLKKLNEAAPAAPAAAPAAPAAAPSPPPAAAAAPAVPPAQGGTAQELSCNDSKKLRSVSSTVATTVTFINVSGMYRSVQWIDFKGDLKDFGGLNAGDKLTVNTFVTHPWMISTGPGDCLQIFMPDAVPATVQLMRLAADDHGRGDDEPMQKTSSSNRERERENYREPEPKKKPKPEPKPLKCGQNYKLRNGECVLIQNCGANAYRSPEGDCYCNKNYQMKNGKCVWKTDKQGFEVAPWKKAGCKGLQAACNAGSNKACGQYEANCQVN